VPPAIPRIWVLDAAAFPQNHTGKVLRRELQARFTAEMQAE
jgi:hypothetical protein